MPSEEELYSFLRNCREDLAKDFETYSNYAIILQSCSEVSYSYTTDSVRAARNFARFFQEKFLKETSDDNLLASISKTLDYFSHLKHIFYEQSDYELPSVKSQMRLQKKKFPVVPDLNNHTEPGDMTISFREGNSLTIKDFSQKFKNAYSKGAVMSFFDEFSKNKDFSRNLEKYSSNIEQLSSFKKQLNKFGFKYEKKCCVKQVIDKLTDYYTEIASINYFLQFDEDTRRNIKEYTASKCTRSILLPLLCSICLGMESGAEFNVSSDKKIFNCINTGGIMRDYISYMVRNEPNIPIVNENQVRQDEICRLVDGFNKIPLRPVRQNPVAVAPDVQNHVPAAASL